MPRTVLTRLVTALWGVWFAAALLGPPALHSCPAERSHGSAAARGGHDAHAGHASHLAGASHHTDAQHHGPDGCNCIGFGCCAAQVASPATPLTLAPDVVVAPRSTAYADAPVIATQRAYALPFANGPPAI